MRTISTFRSRFWFSPLFAGLLIFVLLAGSRQPQPTRPPNVILLLADDLGYGDLACFGHPTIQSPHLDQLAREGLTLRSCYSASPVCSPSRAGLLTGRTPNRLGIYDWIPKNTGVYLRETETTLAELFQKKGYTTGHFGKWHLNSRTDGSERDPGQAGFNYYFYTQNNALPDHHNPINFVRNGQPVGPMSGYSSALVVDEAMQFLDKQTAADKPFFLNVWFHEPHEVVATAPEYTRLYPNTKTVEQAMYFGNVTQMDAAVGRLMAYLDKKGLRENIIVIFTSDNGPETLNRYPKSNHSYGSPGPLRGMKLHVTEGGDRVPGIMRWPGHIKPGRTSDEPVSSLDFLPTLCSITGAALPTKHLDGTSLLPLLTNNKPLNRKQPLFWQYNTSTQYSHTPWTTTLRHGDWKLLANARLDTVSLYNMRHDIGEKTDLSARQPGRTRQLVAQMQLLKESVKREGDASGNPAAQQK